MTDQIIVSFKDRLVLPLVRRLPRWLTPNQLTIARLALVPLVVGLLWADWRWTGGVLFLLVFLTDALDGALARSRNQVSDFGKVVDPLADKLLFLPVFLVLGWPALPPTVVWATLVMEASNLIVVTLALYLRQRGRRDYVHGANVFGKVKMMLQVVGCAGLLLWPAGNLSLELIFWSAVVAGVVSVARHVVALARQLWFSPAT